MLATGVWDIFKNLMIRIENLLKILHSGLRRRFGQEAGPTSVHADANQLTHLSRTLTLPSAFSTRLRHKKDLRSATRQYIFKS